MSVEFIGFVGNYYGSETIPRRGPILDKRYVSTLARVHENAGFDRVLLAFHSTHPDDIIVGQFVTAATDSLALMIAHRPGFCAPTVAARQFATLDQISDGRVAVHVIAGNDTETARDGDFIHKDERYNRTREYLDIMRLVWNSPKPFSYEGKHYKVSDSFSEIKPVSEARIPIFFGGASEAAIEVAGKHADIYALWGETYDQVREMVGRVRAAALPFGRSPRFSLSFRPILADTEAAAWKKAEAIAEKATKLIMARGVTSTSSLAPVGSRTLPPNEGARRLLAAAEKGPRLDKCLWTGMAALTGASGNTTCLVGTPDQVAECILDYYRLGVTSFLIRGFDPVEDANQYGRDLIPLVRKMVSEEPARHPVAAAS